MTKVCQFQATTKADYYLVQGFPATFLSKGTALTVFGQLPNGRWRCCVELAAPSGEPEGADSGVSSRASSSTSLGDKSTRTQNSSSELLIGSVPSSLLAELDEAPPPQFGEIPKIDLTLDGTPTVSPDSTPRQRSPLPSPPGSPYSPHRGGDRRPAGEKQPIQPNWRSLSAEVVGHIVFPSPPSSTVSSRSSSPFSMGESLDDLGYRDELERNSALVADLVGEGSGDDVRETYIGSDSEDHVTVAEKSAEGGDVVRRRPQSE